MDRRREERLRKVSEEFRDMLERDEDNGGPLLEGGFEYYRELAAFRPRYLNIPRKGVINKIRRHFYQVFTIP